MIRTSPKGGKDNKMSKRKENNYNQPSKRFKWDEALDTDINIEEDLLNSANDYELWGTDDGTEQLMAEALDRYEENQQGGARRNVNRPPEDADQPADAAEHPDEAQQTADAAKRPEDAQQPADDAEQQPRIALNGAVSVTTLHPTRNADVLQAFRELEPRIMDTYRERLQQSRNIRGYMSMEVTYSRIGVDGERYETRATFQSRIRVIVNENLLQEDVAAMMREIYEHSQEFEAQGSGWSIQAIENVQLHNTKYKPLAASSYFPTPKEILLTRAVLNIKNNDEKCIVWCILAQLHTVSFRDHPERVANYHQYEAELNIKGISFPTPLKDIKRIETQNDLSINVFGYDREEKVYPLYLSKSLVEERHINLLLICQGEKQHYCLIRSFSRLMKYRTKHNGAKYFCYSCLHGFEKRDLLG